MWLKGTLLFPSAWDERATECSVLTFRATSPEYAPRAGLSSSLAPFHPILLASGNSHEGLWASGEMGQHCLLPQPAFQTLPFFPISSGWASFHSTFLPPPRLISHQISQLRRNLVWLYLTSGPSFTPNLVCVGLASPHNAVQLLWATGHLILS